MWYHGMPESIICQEGTYFSAACQVKASCSVKVDVDWYWSPENASNSTHIIENSGNARIRALHSQTVTCTNNSMMLRHLYTLTLAELSSENAGLYWCQLKILKEHELSTETGDMILPSDKLYVGVEDTLTGCKYGKHKDEWRCALSQASTSAGESTEEVFYSRVPGTELVTVGKPSPTLEPLNDRDTPPIKMEFTILEVVLFVVVLLCAVTIIALVVFLLCRHRRKRAGE